MPFKYFKYLIVLTFIGRISYSQLLVSPNSSASALVNQIVGNNVTITNPVINCNAQATGLFVSNGSNIGLTNGIMLCTGKIQNAIGPNNAGGAGNAFSTSANFNDANLSSIEPQAKYDGCVLEFDITPVCNKLEIKYVFGSEEYPEYVGKNFNDAFGFFMWGPNPSGGTYNGYNIARLPNGTPVSIDNINNGPGNSGPCVNCAYYVDNTNGSTIQYDAFTVPLTAQANVKPCSTYHLKLVIADAGDAIYDSGVFLQYKGIGCANTSVPAVATSTTSSKCDLNNGTATASVSNYTGTVSYAWSPGGQTTATATNLAPGNYTCTLDFLMPCPYTATVAVTIPHDAGFTYSTTINNIKCPQDANGSATVTANGGFSPYTYNWNTSPSQNGNTVSGLSLGEYICTITDAMGCVKKDTVEIFATTTLTAHPVSSDALCGNPTGGIQSNPLGGVPAYTYTWSTNPTQNTKDATGLVPGNYSVTIQDQDGCKVTTTVTVNNFIPTITLQDSLVNATCSHQNGAIYINNVIGGTAPYTYTWNTTPAQNSSSATGLWPGAYMINVEDVNHCPVSQTFTIIDQSSLPIVFTKKDDKCDQKKGTAQVTVIGGSPGYTYLWSDGQTTPAAVGLGQGSYTVDITDALGCQATETVQINNYNDVFNGSVEVFPTTPEVNVPFTVTLHPTSVWDMIYGFISDGTITTDTSNRLMYQDYGWYNITYYLVSKDGCKDTIRYDFFVKDFMTIYVPNTFTPNGDGNNDTFFAKGTLVKDFKMYVYDRWGELLFKSNDINEGWDGTYKGAKAKEDVYVYKIFATDFYEREQTFVGHINLIR